MGCNVCGSEGIKVLDMLTETQMKLGYKRIDFSASSFGAISIVCPESENLCEVLEKLIQIIERKRGI